MRLGAVLPQREIGASPDALREWVAGVEAAGFDHVLVYEHVAGIEGPAGLPPGPYDAGSDYHEPFVLFGFLAALTRLELVTGVVVTPQRQTLLVAKQAAEVAVLSRGGLRLGVGVGWNRAEYAALGRTFHDRGRRLDEQIGVFRALWAQPTVGLAGGGPPVGISPRPIAPIPIWVGGSSPAAYVRAGRLGDGWFPQMQPGAGLQAARRTVLHAASDAGRDPAMIGMQGRAHYTGCPRTLRRDIDAWGAAGATHLAIDTMDAGLLTPAQHLAALDAAPAGEM